MKAIGTIVAVLLVAMGAAMYLVTRSPNRELDAQERAWVDRYERWTEATGRQIDRAAVEMGFSSKEKNARLIEPLRRCSVSFARIGEPPALLKPVEADVIDACGRAEHAVQVNDRFGAASLATIKLHLGRAEEGLRVSRRTLAIELGDAD